MGRYLLNFLLQSVWITLFFCVLVAFSENTSLPVLMF